MQKSTMRVSVKDPSDPSFIAKLVQIAGEFSSKIYFDLDDKCINAKSFLGMMNLRLEEGMDISAFADGNDEAKALESIERFLGGE
ncbi:MAG: HPr family phosphocarrier protein [Clostridiales bacterium]|nr:HPr family phosphocarrier protein [Clostridiales bacterium]